VAGMLAAETPSMDAHMAAATPRRRGMDRKSKNNSSKKLVQARLPFKRLNPEPKENQVPKRRCKHACPEPGAADVDDSSTLPPHGGPPLVNGRGPLDGFLSRRRPEPSNENIIVDLTADETLSPTKCLVSPASASPPLRQKDNQGKSETSGKSSDVDHTCNLQIDQPEEVTTVDQDDAVEEIEDVKESCHIAGVSELDLNKNSESETDEQDEEQVSCVKHHQSAHHLNAHHKRVMASHRVQHQTQYVPHPNGLFRSLFHKCFQKPKTSPKIPEDQRKSKRRSLRNLQEQEEKLRKAKEELKKSKLEFEWAHWMFLSCLRAKQEEKRKKEEEKRMKEEEKRLKEEKDRLKAEKAEITRFLQKPKIQQAPKTLAAACGKFAPFEIKENVYLAPLCRVQREDGVLEELDRCLLNQAENWHGLKDWIGRRPRQSGPTKPAQSESSSDCVAVEGPRPDGVPDRKRYGPMKLLQFRENYRPAYWGTWSKRSSHVSPRCPFRQDKNLLDYEVDSDEEWEEEEPGESLSHSEGEDEEEGGDDDDDDDGFFVPHGYLSDDEGAQEEEESGDPEKLKLHQKLKAREWDELMSTKKKMKVLEPVVRGCVWEGEGAGLQLLQPYAMCLVEPLPKADSSPSQEELTQRCQRDQQLLGQLLPLLHGNVNSSKMIITEFQEFCRQQAAPTTSPSELSSPQSSPEHIPTRIQVKRLIKENAVYEKRPSYKRCCWYVHAEMLSRFGQEALPVPCQWTYLTAGAREESNDEPQAATGSQGNSPTTPQTTSTTSASKKRKSAGSMSITKFMKRCTEAEKRDTIGPDGFQADTEDDEEEDCVIVSTQPG
uniref:Chromatin assembly factor 1, subunit A (p150) n=1 Tax=Tetraodon nigroviridis TaxID=99883 RepID=H3D6M0_TETNG